MEPVTKLRAVDRQSEVDVRTASPSTGILVGECVDARHPTLQGRARVRWVDAQHRVSELWVPMLMTITVRDGDRVLLVTPSNFDEPVIVGVLDGFAARPAQRVNGGPTLELQKDESVRIQARDGQELLEVSLSGSGPVVKLLTAEMNLHLPGELKISAESIALDARQGSVAVSATDDVVVTGAAVRLN